jgi:hypothetical protein
VRNREVSTMHVFAGGTWMVSKLVRQPRDVDGDGVVDPIDGCANPPWGWSLAKRKLQSRENWPVVA